MKAVDGQTVAATFPKAPLRVGPDGDRSVKIVAEAPYLVKTAGTCTFPWRFLVITEHDTQLAANQLAYKLNTPNRLPATQVLHRFCGQVWYSVHPHG